MIGLAPVQEPTLTVSPRGAPVDSEVTVSMAGLPPQLGIIIGLGSLSAHELIAQADTDAEGSVRVVVTIPYWAELDRPHVFFYAFADQRPRGFHPFHVTAADGTARVTGTIRAGGTSCVALDGPGGALYTLQGEIGDWAPGTRVTVIGRIAQGPACSGEGLPISVREIRPA